MSEKKRAKKIPLEDALESLIVVKEFFEDWHTELIGAFGESEPEPTPRPLSKGDWAIERNTKHLVLYVGRNTGENKNIYPHSVIKINGEDDNYANVLTRIDTLTEEHLRMLNTEDVKYNTHHNGEDDWWVEQHYHNPYFFTCFKGFPSKHEAISECLKSVISRRRFDREMGV